MKLTDNQLQDLACQLRCPNGNDGIKAGEMMNHTNSNIINKTIISLDIKVHDSLLEIGPGNGAHVKNIEANNTITYIGIDISVTMIAEAARINSGLANATFQLTDADSISFVENQFDKIFTVNTIYFWNDPQGYTNQIAHVLKPGGLVAIGFIPKSTIRHIPFAKFGFTLYDIDTVISLLQNAGLVIVSKNIETEMVTSNSGVQIEREFVIITATKQ